jgi:hypothetical protein
MSNELVYGSAQKFVSELAAADAEAKEFFDGVVTYLSGCVKSLCGYSETLTGTETIPATAWSLHVESSDDVFSLSSNYATLTLQRSHPLGTVRYLIVETFPEGSWFSPRSLEGYISFVGLDTNKEKKTESGNPKGPAIYSSEGTVPATFKTETPATFAEPLFSQLFAPLPITDANAKPKAAA